MRDVPGPVDGAMDVGLKQVVLRTIDEAARRGASNVEAEHLLLVISAGDDAAARTLAEFGLDHAAVEAALDAERSRALEVAGVAPIAEDRLRSTRRTRPGWGASLRDALRRAEFRTNRARGRTREEREQLASPRPCGACSWPISGPCRGRSPTPASTGARSSHASSGDDVGHRIAGPMRAIHWSGCGTGPKPYRS